MAGVSVRSSLKIQYVPHPIPQTYIGNNIPKDERNRHCMEYMNIKSKELKNIL